MVRQKNGEVELFRKLLKPSKELIEFLASFASQQTNKYLLALRELSAARIVLT